MTKPNTAPEQVTQRPKWKYVLLSLIGIIVIVLAVYVLPLNQVSWELFKLTHLPLGKVGSEFVSSTDLIKAGALIPGHNLSQEISQGLHAYGRQVSINSLVKTQSIAIGKKADSHAYIKAWWAKNENLNKSGFVQINKIKQLRNQNQSFQDIARTYSDDTGTKNFGGDAGFVNLNDLQPEYAADILAMAEGQEKVVGSRNGVHFVWLKDTITDSSDGIKRYHIFDIFVRDNGKFDIWLNTQAATVPVSVFIP